MKKHLKTHKHHYLHVGLVVFGSVAVYLLSVFGFTLAQSNDTYAVTYDSSVQFLITGDYHGSITLTSTNHSVGTCSSAAGQDFTVSSTSYKTCQGVAMGSPDGMQVYAPGTAPSGYTISMVVTSSTANGQASCSGRMCSFNYSSGAVTVQIRTTVSAPPQQPTAPSASLNGVTSSSVSVSWSSGSAGSYSFYDYLPYFNGSAGGTTQNRSATYQGLACNTRYTFYVAMRTSAGNYNSNTVYATTSACPVAPKPAPAPTPAPSPPSSGGGGSASSPSGGTSGTSSGSGSSSSTSTSTKTSRATDTSTDVVQNPPAAPTDFKASANEGSSTISLSWKPGTSSEQVHYMLERSLNQQEWTLLNNALSVNAYSDSATLFSTHYYYRLTAIDTDNLTSPSVTLDVKSGVFKANAGDGHGVTLISRDGVVSITISAEAFDRQANCSLADHPVLPLVGRKDYLVAAGPYQIICQHQDATIMQKFKQPIKVRVNKTDAMKKTYKHWDYRGYAPTHRSWQQLPVKDNQTVFTMPANQMALTILGQTKHTPGWLIALIVILVVAGGSVFGLALVGNIMRRRRLQAQQEDYWHKMNGV